MVDHLGQVFEEARAEGELGISWEIRERGELELGGTSDREQTLVKAIRADHLRASESPAEREKVSGDIEITAKEVLLELLTGELFGGREDGKGKRKGQRLGVRSGRRVEGEREHLLWERELTGGEGGAQESRQAAAVRFREAAEDLKRSVVRMEGGYERDGFRRDADRDCGGDENLTHRIRPFWGCAPGG